MSSCRRDNRNLSRFEASKGEVCQLRLSAADSVQGFIGEMMIEATADFSMLFDHDRSTVRSCESLVPCGLNLNAQTSPILGSCFDKSTARDWLPASRPCCSRDTYFCCVYFAFHSLLHHRQYGHPLLRRMDFIVRLARASLDEVHEQCHYCH